MVFIGISLSFYESGEIRIHKSETGMSHFFKILFYLIFSMIYVEKRMSQRSVGITTSNSI